MINFKKFNSIISLTAYFMMASASKPSPRHVGVLVTTKTLFDLIVAITTARCTLFHVSSVCVLGNYYIVTLVIDDIDYG